MPGILERNYIVICYMSSNPVHHECTKHIELVVHFVREKVAVGQCKVLLNAIRTIEGPTLALILHFLQEQHNFAYEHV